MIVSYRSFHSGLSASIRRTFHLRDQCFMLCFALNRRLDRLMVFEIDEALDRIFLREPGDESTAVLINPPNQIVRHSDVKDAVRLARQDIYVSARHPVIVRRPHAWHKTSSWPGSSRPSTFLATAKTERGCPAQGRA